MALRFSKQTVLTLFCLFRQAERSIHYALSCPNQWPQFVAYYDESKQAHISEVLGVLKKTGAVESYTPSRQAVAHAGLLSIVRYAAGLLCNPLKRSWAFSLEESSFFSATLEHILEILDNADLPKKEELIEIRLDCLCCHSVIARKLLGVAAIRKADSIEHFNQSGYVNHVTFEDMGIHSS